LINKVEKGDRPKRFSFVDRSQGRLDHARQMVHSPKTDAESEYIQNADPALNDKIMQGFPPYSLILNATAMGKDTPGRAIPNLQHRPGNPFPRGELGFVRQALAQVEGRRIGAEDDWLYLVHGWRQVVDQVLHFDLAPSLFAELNEAAESLTK
jgi:hypothetical protein